VAVPVTGDPNRVSPAVRIRNLYTLFNLQRSQFQLAPRPQVAAGRLAIRTSRQHIVGLELLLASLTPETGRHKIKVQPRPLGQGPRRKCFKGKLQRIGHYSAEGANAQADDKYLCCPAKRACSSAIESAPSMIESSCKETRGYSPAFSSARLPASLSRWNKPLLLFPTSSSLAIMSLTLFSSSTCSSRNHFRKESVG